MAEESKKSKQVQINTSDEMSRGRFSNTMFITHNPEEFVLDWILNSPSGVHLVSRIIVTPGHMKRIIAALSDNLKKYEQKFGEVATTAPADQQFH